MKKPWTNKIPLVCDGCGNCVLTPRTLEEQEADCIVTSYCNICDVGGMFEEMFYVRNGKTYSYGEWMDYIETLS